MHHLMSNMQQIIVFVVKIRLSAKTDDTMDNVDSTWRTNECNPFTISELKFPETFRFVSLRKCKQNIQ